MLVNDGVRQKTEPIHTELCDIVQVYTNGTIQIRCGNTEECLNIRRITPFHDKDDEQGLPVYDNIMPLLVSTLYEQTLKSSY